MKTKTSIMKVTNNGARFLFPAKDVTEDQEGGGVAAHLSDFGYVGGTLTLRSLQLRLKMLFFSSKLKRTTEARCYL